MQLNELPYEYLKRMLAIVESDIFMRDSAAIGTWYRWALGYQVSAEGHRGGLFGDNETEMLHTILDWEKYLDR